MSQIIFRQDQKELFNKSWENFVAKGGFSPYYLLTNIDYLLAYSDRAFTVDMSFVVLKNNSPMACVFLPIEKDTITIGKRFVPAPIFLSQKGLEEEIMANIDQIAREEKIKKIMFRIDPLEKTHYSYNYLLNYNYLNASLTGYVLDCQDISMRRNHRRAIKKIKDNSDFSIQIINQGNADYKINEQFRHLHYKCAGRTTRPRETFDLQFRMLKEGNATLFGLKFKNYFIAFTYFSHHAGKAVSYSAADDPDFDHLPLYHIINYAAIKYFQKKDVTIIDMGQPLTTSHQLFYHPDDKQKNISLFKTGFAGHLVPNFQAIKYFDRQTFEVDMGEFTKKYQISSYE